MKDLQNHKLGRLTVLRFVGRNKQSDSLWQCSCECGNEVIVSGGSLNSNKTKSCGCLQKERASASHRTHGLTYDYLTGKPSRLYKIWGAMKRRCLNENDQYYLDYGGRGIGICVEWRDDFLTFYNWSHSHGYNKNLSIDRIDNDGSYEPSNCRWATKQVQSRNRRNKKLLTFNGITKANYEWAEELEIPLKTFNLRIQRGWPVEKIITTKFNYSKSHTHEINQTSKTCA